MKLTELKSSAERIELLRTTVLPFSTEAWKHDKDATFPFENIEALKKIDYHTLTIPTAYGGIGITLLELIQLQEEVAKADGSTALAIGWHMGIMKDLGERHAWSIKILERLYEDVKKNGALINNAASEVATGSPTRGGKPETIAHKKDDTYIITGRKTFTTMAPMLDYFVVSASISGSNDVGNFLISKSSSGLAIEETWDSVAMRGTGSHDLVLNEVCLPKTALVEYLSPGRKQAAGWLLHIPACYLGIAKAAQAYALQFACSYSPNSTVTTINELPYVKEKIGEMELYIRQSQYFLYSVAKSWDEACPHRRNELKGDLAAVKHSVVNHALKVVDLAMRVTGARSLSERNPLQRYYRDVRAGLHNPPMDDAAIVLLADEAIERSRKRE